MTSDLFFSAHLDEVLAGRHMQPETLRLLRRQADRKAKQLAEQRKALADCAADRVCARELKQEGVPDAAVADAVKHAERDRALLEAVPQINGLLRDLVELRALMP